jgi:hypothetical protein
MKRFFLTFCVLFFAVGSIAAQGSYVPYYHLVNRAKWVQCVDADCDSAIAYYLQAFEMVDYILWEDLQHFTRCAAMQGRDSLVYYAMGRCVAQTISLTSTIFSDTLFDKYKNTEKWNECYAIEQENKEKYKEAGHIGILYRKVLDSLLPSDQEERKKWHYFYRFFPNTKKAKQSSQRWHIADSCNRLVLDEMIEKYDFPNERNGCPNDYLFLRGGVLLIHYRDTNFLRNIEYKALVEGKVAPERYATKAKQTADIYNWNIIDYTYYYRKKMTPEEKAQVDKNRYAIGLRSVEEEKIMTQCRRLESQQRKALEAKQKKAKKKH